MGRVKKRSRNRVAERLPASSQDDVKAASATVPRVRSTHRCYPSGVTRNGQPVMDCRTNSAALDRGFAAPMVTGDQKNEPVAGGNRPVQRCVDRRPCIVETVAVKIDDPVGLHRSGPQFAIPGAVKGRARSDRRRKRFRRLFERSGPGLRDRSNRLWLSRGYFWSNVIARGLPRERSDGRRDASPEVGFLRAERSRHAAPRRDRRCPSERARRRLR